MSITDLMIIDEKDPLETLKEFYDTTSIPECHTENSWWNSMVDYMLDKYNYLKKHAPQRGEQAIRKHVLEETMIEYKHRMIKYNRSEYNDGY